MQNNLKNITMENKRTISLTHEQLTTIYDALSIARVHYNSTYFELCKMPQNRDAAKFWFDKSNEADI